MPTGILPEFMAFILSRCSMAGGLLFVAAASMAQLKPLDHSVYDSWKSISQRSLSPDGKWAAIAISPQEGDNTVTVRNLEGGATYNFVRGTGLRFTQDSRFLIGTQVPEFLVARQARRDRKKPEDQPKNSLLILDLSNGSISAIEKVQSWSMASKGGKFLIYRPEPAPPAAPARPSTPGAAPVPDVPEADQKEGESKEVKKKSDHAAGSLHILREVATGREIKLENASSFVFTEKGDGLLVTVSTKDGKGDGVEFYDLTAAEPKSVPVISGMGRYPRVILSKDGARAAILTDKDDYAAKTPSLNLYLWKKGSPASALVKAGAAGLKEGWILSNTGIFAFSESASALYFATRPKPVEDAPLPPEDERVTLDVWNWQDKQMQLAQLRTAEAERNRTYEARIDLGSGKIVQLEDIERRSVTVPGKLDAKYGIAVDTEKYQRETSWTEGRADYSLVDLQTGTGRLIEEGLNGSFSPSPTGKWILVTHDAAKELYVLNPTTGEKVRIGKGLPSLFDEEVDTPSTGGLYGIAGWLAGEDKVLVYDRYDIWLIDVTGNTSPVNITRGAGRALKVEFRLVTLDPDQDFVSPTDSLLFSSNYRMTKTRGYFRGDATGKTRPVELIGGDKLVAGLSKAENSDRILFTQQRFDVFPDVWTSKLDFSKPEKLTDANPQQKEYLWGTSELINFTSNDGDPLEGVLIKPGGFDPSKSYPMVVYFYEKESDRLHNYVSPSPSASTINPSYFASNGYVVFIPDIPYKIGYPGESAVSAILPGVQKVLSMGFVDPKRMGLQGQSWGGYQTAYLVTETNMFAAACAGAPVSNMFSAYGGIRYGTGVVRQFQYEVGQSRIGKTIWEAPMRYFENSPLFFADKVKTPLMIMSNDQDGAVPWTEGIQLFSALRRLNQPVWMVTYNGEDHNLVQRKNRKDFSIRLSQFFDHYLKGAPMPVWMADGIPASQKGKTMGLELKPKG